MVHTDPIQATSPGTSGESDEFDAYQHRRLSDDLFHFPGYRRLDDGVETIP